MLALIGLPQARTLSATALVSLMCLSFWPVTAIASTLAYNFGYRSEYSDNITRIEDQDRPEWDIISTLTAGFSYIENTSTFNARVAGSASYFDYYRDFFDSEIVSTLDAYAELYLVPRAFSWVVADGFRQVRVDPREADIPTNRRNSNVFVTGPNVYLHLGSVDTVTFEARTGNAGIEGLVEGVDIDNERVSFATRWAHRLSTWSVLTLNHEYLDVSYQDSGNIADYQRHDFFLRTDIRSARNNYSLDVGKTIIELEPSAAVPSGDRISNWLARLAVTRQINSFSSINAQYGREYSDSAAQLLPGGATSQPTPGTVVQPGGSAIVASELFYTEQSELFYARRGNTFPWTARLFTRNVDYELSGENREEKGGLINASYLYSSSLSFLASASLIVTTYTDPIIRKDRDLITGIGLLYRLGRSLTAGADLNRYVRLSSVDGQDYTDNRIGVTLTYYYLPVSR